MDDYRIEVLEGLDHIKKRPGMYVGSVDTPSHLLRELVDNAIDEALNKFADTVSIETHDDHFCVSDNGRGLPTYVDEQYGIKAARLVFEQIFSGGKFSGENYRYSSGLHGVGLTVVNALSRKLVVLTSQSTDKPVLRLVYENSQLVEEVELDRSSAGLDEDFKGTKVCTWPDPGIFESLSVNVNQLQLQLASKISGSKFILNGEEVSPFNFDDYVKDHLKDVLFGERSFEINVEVDGIKFQAGFGWSQTNFDLREGGSVNLVPTNAGWHLNKFHEALGYYLESKGAQRSDFKYGLRLFSLVLAQDPIFTSQTKERLSKITGVDDKQVVQSLLDAINDVLKDEEEFVTQVIKRIEAYKLQLGKLADRQFIQKVVIKGKDPKARGLGIGIYDATTKNREQAELFIVEGQSAGSNLMQKRNKKTQAVLPLKGKPMNVVKRDNIRTILSNNEMRALVNSIGVGVTPDVDISQARYGKVILVADADPDGQNILALTIGAISYLIPELIEVGMLYIVIPPLYKQNRKFFWSKKDLDPNKPFTRFKGLGEMNPSELEEVALNPETRNLVQVQMSDREKVLSLLRTVEDKKEIMAEIGVVIY